MLPLHQSGLTISRRCFSRHPFTRWICWGSRGRASRVDRSLAPPISPVAQSGHRTAAEPRLDLLGVSIGGWTATNLAVRDPDKIRAVILLDPVFVFGPISTAGPDSLDPGQRRLVTEELADSFNSWTANGGPVRDVPAAEMIEAGMQRLCFLTPQPATDRRPRARRPRAAGARHPRWKVADARLPSRSCSWRTHTSCRAGIRVPRRVSRNQRRIPGSDRRGHRTIPAAAHLAL